MTVVTISRRARLSALAVACVVVLAVVLAWLNATSDRAKGDPRSEVVVGSTVRDGWKTVEYRGVEVDVPATWERVDMSDCEFQFERWAPPESAPCHFEEGMGFYSSATFDPMHGPGVRHTTGDDG